MIDILKGYGLGEDEIKKLVIYKDLLLEWNKVMNLTAITDEREIAVKHFIDSLAPLSYIDFKNKSVIDVGTGAGFPGLPLKIAENSIKLTLLDSLSKRIGFLKEVTSALQLEDVNCIHGRAEELGQTDLRETFHISTSRAVASLPVLSEFCLPLVKVGGYFIALKGPDPSEEIALSQNAVSKLGGEIEDVKTVTTDDYSHTLIFIYKKAPTPSKYPRSFSKIKKSPIK